MREKKKSQINEISLSGKKLEKDEQVKDQVKSKVSRKRKKQVEKINVIKNRKAIENFK